MNIYVLHICKVLHGGIEPLMTCKMYNSRVVCAWLAECASDHAARNPTEENALLSGCVSDPQRTLSMRMQFNPRVSAFNCERRLNFSISIRFDRPSLSISKSKLPLGFRVAGNNMVLCMENAGRYLPNPETKVFSIISTKSMTSIDPVLEVRSRSFAD